MALVSVIIPVYKIESYIDRCIQSIRNQTYKNLEIILVDDGSPDMCGEICDQYAEADERIQVIHKANGGLSDARNAGILVARGKYLLFVDGDDFIHEKLVERVIRCAEEKQADIVVFDYISVEEDTGREDAWSMGIARNKVMNAEMDPRLLVTTPGAWNKLYRRDFWMSTGLLYPVGRNFEDLSTTPKLLLKAKRVVYLNSEPLYYYILRDGSIMRNHDLERNYNNRTAALDDVIQYFHKHGRYEKFRQELEYLTFEHGFFVPCKEIVLEDRKSPYLEMFRSYAYGLFPHIEQNPYIKAQLSKKDRLLLQLIRTRQYRVMNALSKGRKLVDSRKKETK